MTLLSSVSFDGEIPSPLAGRGVCSIVVDDSAAYAGLLGYGSPRRNVIVSVPLDGGSPKVIVNGISAGGMALAVDGNFVYIADGMSISKVPLDGGPQVFLSAFAGPALVAVDDDSVYWVGNGSQVFRTTPK